jgi:hypothetical protein
MIGHPSGETTSGVCKLCGATRDFLTSPERLLIRRKDPPAPATAKR